MAIPWYVRLLRFDYLFEWLPKFHKWPIVQQFLHYRFHPLAFFGIGCFPSLQPKRVKLTYDPLPGCGVDFSLRKLAFGDYLFWLLWFGAILITVFLGLDRAEDANQFDERRYTLALGDVVVLNLIFMYMSVTRNSLAQFIFGIPLERSLWYHRWVGRIVVILVSLHANYGLIGFGGGANAELEDQFARLAQFTPDFYGIVAGSCIWFLTALTWNPIRRQAYEAFFYSHIILSAFIPPFVCSHYFALEPQAEVDAQELMALFILSVLLYAIDRISRFFAVFLNVTTLESIKAEEIEVTRVEMKKLFGQHYEGGQYVFVQFPQLNWLHRWEAHPFSISSKPGEDTFTLHIKAMPGNTWTSELREKAESQEITSVRCSAPYGRLSINIRDYPVLLLVAGGIGVTPIISIAQELAAMEEKTYQKVIFVWAVRNPKAFDWFSEALSTLKSTEGFDVRLYASRGEESGDYLRGRPDVATLYDDLANEEGDVGVAVCGPPELVDDHNHYCGLNNNFCGRQFHFHSETFIF